MEKNNHLIVTSSAFKEGENIPAKYTCDGEEINPSLKIDNIPAGTKTLAIVVEDPDAPRGTFDHWLVWNMPPESIVEENRISGISGMNGGGKTGYYGPCPPSGSHRYYFHVFALDTSLDIKAGSDKKTLNHAMQHHILAQGSLMGRYARSKK
jgi:Raf kinase inhibitor-like protein, YbhB/YbcL family